MPSKPFVDQRLTELGGARADHAKTIEVESARLVRIRCTRQPAVPALLPAERLHQLCRDLLCEQSVRFERIQEVEADQRVGQQATEVVHHGYRPCERLRRERSLLEQEVA